MDVCKVADIIIPLLSCKLCEVNQINQNPFEKANAFDELG
jgi:pre-rRNA-processing protein TSR1